MLIISSATPEPTVHPQSPEVLYRNEEEEAQLHAIQDEFRVLMKEHLPNANIRA